MFTTDLALKLDPAFGKISGNFYKNPDQFKQAFAKAWYKLTHRDMGPVSRLLGPDVPEAQIWQDPVPSVDHQLIDSADIASLKDQINNSGLTISQLVKTAWASASTFRGSDKRGGSNGARIRLAPQKDWPVNNPDQLSVVLESLEKIHNSFNDSQTVNKKVSMADLIVLAGCAAIEKAAEKAGHSIEVPFTPGRTDATQEMTDVDSFAVLEPESDGFRNFFSHQIDRPAPELLIDRAQLLTLSAPEMVVLIGGLRVLNANTGFPGLGTFTHRPETLTNDFFVNLLDNNTSWQKSNICDHFFEGRNRSSAEIVWSASSVDLVLASNSQLRAISEVYASSDSQSKFISDFVKAWNKVMNL